MMQYSKDMKIYKQSDGHFCVREDSPDSRRDPAICGYLETWRFTLWGAKRCARRRQKSIDKKRMKIEDAKSWNLEQQEGPCEIPL